MPQPAKLTFLEEVCREVGAWQLSQQKPTLERLGKGGHDFATAVDVTSQQMMVERLTQAFPDIPVVAEEGTFARLEGTTFWLVDPIDGTVNFVNRGDQWGIIIGLVTDGQPELGVIYQPARGVFVAVERGLGCTIRRGDGAPQAVVLDHRKPLAETVVGTEVGWWCNASYFRKVLEPLAGRCQGVISLLSAAGSTVALLEGRIGAYINLGIPGKGAKLWDFVVGALAMAKLGGVALAPDGAHLRWDRIPMQAALVASPRLAEEILPITRQWIV